MRFWPSPLQSEPAQAPDLPVLHLDGPVLAGALQSLVSGAEDHGGIERYVDAVRLKSEFFTDTLEGAARLDRNSLAVLCTFMPTVRRRVSTYLDGAGFTRLRDGIADLVAADTGAADADRRIAAFTRRFPADKAHRWVRDLACEVLHFNDPQRYPLMCRWMWDAKANSGVLREIWHGDNVDHTIIDVDDSFETFVVLRQELSGFLTDNGFFRDVPFYVDLLSAQIYADYICAQGGAYLRADFSAPEDPMQHVRRLLGLDGVKPGSLRTRLKTVDGAAFVLDDVKLLD